MSNGDKTRRAGTSTASTTAATGAAIAMLACCGLAHASGTNAADATIAGVGVIDTGGRIGAGNLADRLRRGTEIIESMRQTFDLRVGDEQLMLSAFADRGPVAFDVAPGSRELTGEMLVMIRDDKRDTAMARVARASRLTLAGMTAVVPLPAGVSEGELATMLDALGDYALVSPNYRVFPGLVPNDSQYGSSWQHSRIQSAAAWDISTGSSDVIVAVCDSGVDLDHPDLVAGLVPGYNSTTRLAQADGGQVDDLNGHGTFVAGCAAAQGNNAIGVTGVGWDFGIMPIRVSESPDGSAPISAILDGALWAAKNGARIVNASYSGGTDPQISGIALTMLREGSLLFWAAGNDGSFIEGGGGNYMLVGSTRSNDQRSGFSNFGPAVDITAPGSGVRATRRGGSYGNSSGTSFASPIAAGVGAMVFSVAPDLLPEDARDVIGLGSDDLGSPGRDDSYGEGRVNTLGAIQVAQTFQPRSLAPFDLDFESATLDTVFWPVASSAQVVADAASGGGSNALRLAQGGSVESNKLTGNRINGAVRVVEVDLRGTSIEGGESLLIEYTGTDNAWNTLATIPATDTYERTTILAPNALSNSNLRIRVTAQLDDADDALFVDNLSAGPYNAASLPFVEDFETGDFSALQWEAFIPAVITPDTDGNAMRVRTGIAAESFAIDFVGDATSIPTLRMDIRGDQLAGDETFRVQVLNINNNWTDVFSFDGATASETYSTFEAPLPFLGFLAEGRLRFISSGTNADSGWLVDNIFIGTPQPEACAADLAAPAGELDFFDVLEYLSLFDASDPAADLAAPFGSFDFFDVLEYLSQFDAGC
ncbi:MAG: S8 family serine peptidase [Planctomycetota bacterium]